MKKIAFKNGAIAGLSIIVVMILSMVLWSDDSYMEVGMIIGYSVMLIGFGVSIMLGVKSYRDNERNGKISFLRALAVGGSISAVACGIYSVSWLTYVEVTDNNFYEQYAAFEEKKILLQEISLEEKEEAVVMHRESMAVYNHPVMKAMLTFCEPLPAAILICLIAAFVVKKGGEEDEPELA